MFQKLSMAVFFVLFAIASVKAQSYIVDSIAISGNKKTKNAIILRELVFQPGDTLSEQDIDPLIEESKNNLSNIELFNLIDIVYQIQGDKIEFHVRVEEQWYYIPYIYIRSAKGNFNTWWKTRQWNMLTYGLQVKNANFSGRRDYFSVAVAFGYDNALSVQYAMPYITKKRNFGLQFGVSANASRKVAYTVDNYQLQYFLSNKKIIRKGFSVSAGFTYRPKYHLTWQVDIAYHHTLYGDTIFKNYPDFWTNNTINYFQFYTKLKLDHRNYASYPLEGYYIDVIGEKLGFGLPFEHVHAGSLQTNFRYYVPVVKQLYFGIGMTAYTVWGRYPLQVVKCLGANDIEMRGLYSYLIPAQHLILLKTNFKVELLSPKFVRIRNWDTRIGHLSFACYWNFFSDMVYFIPDANYNSLSKSSPLNQLQNILGMGLDVVTSYDKVIRLEISYDFQLGKIFYGLNFKAGI